MMPVAAGRRFEGGQTNSILHRIIAPELNGGERNRVLRRKSPRPDTVNCVEIRRFAAGRRSEAGFYGSKLMIASIRLLFNEYS